MDITKSSLHQLMLLFDMITVSEEQNQSLSLDDGLNRSYKLITLAKTVWICGNGGSQCQTIHRALDLGRASIHAIALDGAARITADGNDFGQHQIFEAQLHGRIRETDLLWTISCSGWSPDILSAVRLARQVGAKVLTFSGFDAFNPLRGLGHLNFWVNISHYGRVEMMHEILGHTITDLISEGG